MATPETDQPVKENPQTDSGASGKEFGDKNSGSGTEETSKESNDISYKPDAPSPKTSRLKSLVKKRKKGVILVGGGGGIAILLIILLIFLSSLLLPDFASNMLAYQFARVNRSFAKDNFELASEKAALDSQDPTVTEQNAAPVEDNPDVVNEFKDSSGGLWDKMTGWTPKSTFKNLETTGKLSFNNTPKGILQRDVLTSIDVGDQTLNLSQINPSKFSKLVHPFQYISNQVQAATDLNAGLTQALGDETGLIVRGSVENTIRQKAGISLWAYIASKFAGKTPTQASDELDVEAQNKIQPSSDPLVPSDDSAVNKAVADAEAELKQELQDPTKVEAIRANGGWSNTVDNIITSDLGPSILNKLSLLATIAIPLCTIYDSSLQSPNASKTIDEQNNEIQRSFFFIESAADQQKKGGDAANAEAVGAFNNKLGDISTSNVEIRANGGTIDTLSNVQSPETTGNGQYSIANATLPGWAAGVLNAMLTGIPGLNCSTLTDPSTQIAFLAAQAAYLVLSAIFTGGIGDAAGASGEATLEEAAGTVVNEAVDQTIGDAIGQRLSNSTVGFVLQNISKKFVEKFSKKELAKLGAVTVATAGLSLVAKLDTLSKMGETYNGLSQGADFANQADAGANFNSNEVERQEMYGAPLGPADLATNNAADQQFITAQNKSKSAFDRYLAISNPNSFVSKLGVSVFGAIHRFSLGSIVSSVKNFFNPTKLFSSFIGFVSHPKVAAASIVDNNDYGIVQWGYTSQEDSLTSPTSGSPSYQPLENSQMLFQDPFENYIETTYSPCYSDSMGTLLTQNPQKNTAPGMPNPPTEVFNEPYIVRDAQGNVTGGLCSQKYLGPNSADPQAKDGAYGNDMIFRWRLNHAYNNVIDQLKDAQNAGSA